MVKKIIVSTLVIIVVAAAAAGVYQITTASAGQIADGIQIRSIDPDANQGYRGGQPDSPSGNPRAREADCQEHEEEMLLPAPSELSEIEAEGLLLMREEEKLARDVYTELYSVWGLPLFQNIAGSEQAHMDAVKVLLDVYDLPDPAQEQPGSFTNPELQALYDELVTSGRESLAQALKVGAAIEEIDILDLQEQLAQTDNLDIQQVYNNLLRGSENHLRAFTKTLQTQTGETYQPQYMSAADYQAIVSQSMQGSGQGGRVGGGGQGRQGGRS